MRSRRIREKSDWVKFEEKEGEDRQGPWYLSAHLEGYGGKWKATRRERRDH